MGFWRIFPNHRPGQEIWTEFPSKHETITRTVCRIFIGICRYFLQFEITVSVNDPYMVYNYDKATTRDFCSGPSGDFSSPCTIKKNLWRERLRKWIINPLKQKIDDNNNNVTIKLYFTRENYGKLVHKIYLNRLLFAYMIKKVTKATIFYMKIEKPFAVNSLKPEEKWSHWPSSLLDTSRVSLTMDCSKQHANFNIPDRYIYRRVPVIRFGGVLR